MGCIYKIENLVNGKVYIGQTIREPKVRWQQHIQSSRYKNGPQYHNHLYRAMRAYGLFNFSFSVVENCDNSELDKREIHWINYYSSNDADFGYNNTGGGSCKGQVWTTVSQYTKDGEYVATYNNFSEAARETGGDPAWIRKICNGHNALSADSQWRYSEDKPPGKFFRKGMKRVRKYGMDGSFIAEYRNARTASAESGCGYVNILNCLSGRKDSAHGFQWRYEDQDPPGKYVDSKVVSVSQYELDGSYVATYESAISAAESLGGDSTTSSGIVSCCKGKAKTTKGYQWRYANDIPPGAYNGTRAIPRPVFQYSKSGLLVSSYASIADASRATGIVRTAINACCRGKLKTAGGFLWKYAE